METFVANLPLICGVVALAVYIVLANVGDHGPIGVILGEDGRLSTSKAQFFLWTGVVVAAYAALFAARTIHCWVALAAQCTAMPSPSMNVLVAMGFSVVTLATAKGITTSYVASGRTQKSPPDVWHWSDLVSSDGSGPDLSKVQMLIWTLIAVGAFITSVTNVIPKFGLTGDNTFPDIDTTLMALMGIGQGAYLGTKAASSQTATISSLVPARGSAPGQTVSILGSGFGTTPGTVIFDDVVAALAVDASGNPQWGDGKVQFVVPPAHASGMPFKSGDSVNVGLLLQGNSGTAASNTIPFTL